MPLDPGRHHVLRPAAPQAGNIEWLYWVMFWILFAVFVLMIAAFARAGSKTHVVATHPLPILEKDEEGDRRAGWAVGSNGTICRYNGTSWTPQPADGSVSYRGVYAVGSTGYVISGGGKLPIQIPRRIRLLRPPMKFTFQSTLPSLSSPIPQM